MYLSGSHQVPAGGEELVACNAAAFVDPARACRPGNRRRLCPDEVAIAFDDGVRLPALESFFREKRGVNAAVDHPGAACARHAADLVAAQCIAGVHADADNVAGLDGLGVDLLQGFVDQNGVAGRSAAWRRPERTANAA